MRKLRLVNLESWLEKLIGLQDAATRLGKEARINLMLVTHVRVLLRALLECLAASEDRTPEWLLTSVNPNMVLECTH